MLDVWTLAGADGAAASAAIGDARTSTHAATNATAHERRADNRTPTRSIGLTGSTNCARVPCARSASRSVVIVGRATESSAPLPFAGRSSVPAQSLPYLSDPVCTPPGPGETGDASRRRRRSLLLRGAGPVVRRPRGVLRSALEVAADVAAVGVGGR